MLHSTTFSDALLGLAAAAADGAERIHQQLSALSRAETRGYLEEREVSAVGANGDRVRVGGFVQQG